MVHQPVNSVNRRTPSVVDHKVVNTVNGRPVVIVERTGATSVVFPCPHCKHRHVHGVHSVGGHVVAHCTDDSSPYRRTGYWLLLADEDQEEGR